MMRFTASLCLVFCTSCGMGISVNNDAAQAEVEFSDLMPNTMLRKENSSQLSLSQTAAFGGDLETFSGYVGDPSTSATVIPDDPYRRHDWIEIECGLSGSLTKRISECALISESSTFDGPKYGTSAETLWQLVYRKNLGSSWFEIWLDTRTKLFWTSVKTNVVNNVPVTLMQLSWSDAIQTCVDGDDIVHGELSEVLWRLPTVQDFQMASIDGFFELYNLHNVGDLKWFWTSTSVDSSDAYVVLQSSKLRNVSGWGKSNLSYVMCVGRYSGGDL